MPAIRPRIRAELQSVACRLAARAAAGYNPGAPTHQAGAALSA